MIISNRITDESAVIDSTAVAESIPDDAVLAVSGFGSVGYPKAVPLALAKSKRNLSLTVISGGSVGDEIDTVLLEADAITRRYPYQARDAARDAVNAGRIEFQDRHIARLGEAVLLGQIPSPDVAVVEAVAVGTGWLVPSTSIGLTPEYVEAADRLIVEVNYAQPLALQKFHDVYRVGTPPRNEPIPLSGPGERIGGPKITFDPRKLDAVVETEVRDQPYAFRDSTRIDEAIAENLAEFLREEQKQNPALKDSIRIQFGVGNLGNALMGAFESVDFGGSEIVYYGEVIQDGLLDLIDSGKVEVASATSLALTAEGLDRLFERLERYVEDIILRPAYITNRASLVDRFGVISVNTALEVDLYGHVNSTHIDGTQIVNGIGGSGDFTRNGLLSVIALGSTANDGRISRIVPMVPHVDHTEHDIGVIITEHGVADLRGLSPHERASELIDNCADPAFRTDLQSYFDMASDQAGHIPHDLSSAFHWRSDW